MAKYIIELPDKNKHIYINENNVLFLRGTIFKEKLFGKVETHDVHICTGINAFPYYDPDRKAIENETWELAKRLADMSYDDFISCFEGETEEYVYGLPYQEVKAKYETWKKQKDEIHVGDEVQYSLAGYEYTFIVLGKENDTLYGIRSDCKDGLDDVYDGWDTCNKSDHTLVKTGRHFDEVDELLERMKAE